MEFASAEAACKQAMGVYLSSPTTDDFKIVLSGSYDPSDPFASPSYDCIQKSTNIALTWIYTTREPELYCRQSAKGPYDQINDTPSQGIPGAPFDSTMRSKIITKNHEQHPFNAKATVPKIYSDVFRLPNFEGNNILQAWLGIAEECVELILGRPTATPAACYAEVHHLIPATDTQGCPCGRNSNANAFVVSRQLNNNMSNAIPPMGWLKFVFRTRPSP